MLLKAAGSGNHESPYTLRKTKPLPIQMDQSKQWCYWRIGHLSRYVTSHPGQLSLAKPSLVGAMSRLPAKRRWRLATGD